MDDHEARELVTRVESLLEAVEGMPDARAREQCTDLVAALLDLYGEALGRLVRRVPEGAALEDDELVSHMLLVHGIHPVPLEARVRTALDSVRPYLESHGGGVDLVSVGDGVVRLRLEGSCDGCPSSAATLTLAVEDAIRKAAPEIEDVEQLPSAAKPADGSTAGPKPADGSTQGPALIQLAPLEAKPNWATAGVLPQLRGGGTLIKEVEGEELLFCGAGGSLYAYRPTCPSCAGSLSAARLDGAALSCPGCGHAYDVARAGRSIDGAGTHLDPVPLLADDGGLVKVALAAAS